MAKVIFTTLKEITENTHRSRQFQYRVKRNRKKQNKTRSCVDTVEGTDMARKESRMVKKFTLKLSFKGKIGVFKANHGNRNMLGRENISKEQKQMRT